MSSTTHHLTDETLQDYAAGSLDVPMETLVACHLTMCARCRARSGLADSVGGALLDEEAAVAAVTASADDVLSRAERDRRRGDMERTDLGERTDRGREASRRPLPGRPLRPRRSSMASVPRPLARLLPTGLDELDWRRVAPGIRQFNLGTRHRRHGAFKLLHLSPGTTLSEHGHNDRELTYVVRGSYTDELGRFGPGDIADLDERVEHRPVVDPGEPCIALIATHSPVRFSGMLGRIMQPFVGI